MAMAAVVSCSVSSSQVFSHHAECTSAAAAVFARRRRAASAVSIGARPLSCASSSSSSSSLGGGSSLRLALRQTPRRGHRNGGGVVSTRCESEEAAPEKIPFGYTRKDVILIGVALTAFGVGLKYGLEAFGVDSLRAGNVVQIVMVAGLTIGWISSYVFRVSNKDMTYAKQLKDYENKVMEKRLEELPEAELETMLAQVEEEKTRLQQRRQNKSSS